MGEGRRAEERGAARARNRWVLAGVLAAAANLRVAIIVVGPVIETIRGDLGMTRTEAGLLGMIPFLCMSAFALIGPSLLHRIGVVRSVLVGLVLITLGTVLRAIAPTGALLLTMTVPIGIGLALTGVSLPAAVKEAFPRTPGRITGWYVAAMAVGAAAAGWAIVPLSNALGGWREAFAVTAAGGLLAIPLWTRRGSVYRIRAGRERLGLPTGRDVRLGLVFAGVSIGFTGTLTWAAAIYLQNGWSATAAAGVTAGIMLLTIPSALLLPGLSDGGNRPLWTAWAGAAMGLGILGMALDPTLAPVLWVGLFGIGNGLFFSLVLTLPLDLGGTVQEVAPGVAWTMAIGFLLGSTSPVLVGALRDLTGGFAVPMTILALATAAGGLLALTVGRGPGAVLRPARAGGRRA